MKTGIDLVGKQFGLHVVKEYLGRSKNGHARWLTECANCGHLAERHGTNIKRFSVVAGGCRNCSGKPKGYTGLHQLYTQYKLKATKAGRIFELTIDQFREITSSKCHYCGRPPSQVKSSGNAGQLSTWGIYEYNGVDRKNNDQGYLWENSLPCCGVCNHMKGTMSYQAFVSWLDAISIFRRPSPKCGKIQVLIGMIASGKSTYSRNAAHKGFLVLNDDAIVNMLHADDYTLYDYQLKTLYKTIENQVIGTALAMKRNVIIDRGLNVGVRGRKRWVALADSYDVLVEAVIFKNEGPEVHARRRTEHDARGHDYDYWLKVANVHNRQWELPTHLEGFNAIHEVSFEDIKNGKVLF